MHALNCLVEKFFHVELVPVLGVSGFWEVLGGDVSTLRLAQLGVEFGAGDSEEPVAEGADGFVELERGKGLRKRAKDDLRDILGIGGRGIWIWISILIKFSFK